MSDITNTENSTENQDINLTEKTTKNEFATKPPILTKGLLIKIGLGILAIVLLSFILILAISAIKNQKPEIIERPKQKPPIVIEEPVIKGISKIAYIKNGNTIWATDIDGSNRKNLISLPSMNDNGLITSIAWKTKNELSYSRCERKKTLCQIKTYSISDNSQKVILNANKTTKISKHRWSNDKKTLAYIEARGGYTYFNLKSGNIIDQLETFVYVEDKTRTKTRILFTPKDKYIIFYSQKVEQIPNKKKKNSYTLSDPEDTISIYRLNGIKVDEIRNASDPFIIDQNLVGYYKYGYLYYKEIGSQTETLITKLGGLNPVISPNKKLIAFWSNETQGLKKIVLQIFDTKLNIRRDILRGIVLPTWVTDNQIAGIKLDSCLGENCLLYEFQTAGLVIVNLNTSKTTVVDQGDSISDITLNTNAN